MKRGPRTPLLIPAGKRSTQNRRPDSIVALALRAGGTLTEHLHLRGKLDEEMTTDALLGMFFASLSWSIAIAGPQSTVRERCMWGRFRKHKSRNTEETEKYSGADFALLVGDGDSNLRIALFQAKIPENRKDPHKTSATDLTINVHHCSKDKHGVEVGEPQMLRLAKFAAQVEDRFDNDDLSPPAIGAVNWVHYLAYYPDRITAYPLNQFQEAYEQECRLQPRPNHAHLGQLSSTRLTRLLARSFTVRHAGWHGMKIAAARKHFKLLIDLMPIYFVDSDTSGKVSLTSALQVELPGHMDWVSDAVFFEKIKKFAQRIARCENGLGASPS